MKSTTQVGILMLMFALAMGGRIYPWGEPYVLWPNKGMIGEIQLFFSLETPLPAGGVLRVRFPFTSQITATARVYAQTSSRGSVLPPTASSSLIVGSNYFQTTTAPFDNYYTFASALSAGTQYVLRLVISAGPTDAGFLGYIQMETLSAADSVADATKTDSPLRWDSNPVFAPLHILPAPGTLSVSSAIDGSFSPNTASATYNLKLSLKLSQDFWYWPTIAINWDNTNFGITNVVSIDNGTNTTPPTPMTSSQFTATATAGSILINHNATILKSYTVIYNVTVTNPSSLASATLSVWVYHRYNFNLTDYLTNAVQLSVTTVPNPTSTTSASLTNPKILLSWGLDATTLSSTLQNAFHIYASAAGTTKRYQALKFQFDTATTMGTSDYTVSVGICATNANCDVLLNSIDHSFDSSATCTVDTSSGTSVKCTGVTSIKTATNYISARVWLVSTLVTTGAINDANFAVWSISWTKPTAGTLPTTSLDAAYKKATAYVATEDPVANVNGNGPLIATNVAADWTTIGGMADYANTGAAFGLLGGIFVSTSSTSAYYLALISTNDQSATAYVGATINLFGGTTAGTVDKNSGIDLYFNPNIWTVPSSVAISKCRWTNAPDLSGAELASDAATDLHCYSLTTGSSYTRVRAISVAIHATFTSLDTAAPLYWTFQWDGFLTTGAYTSTSLKADRLIDDVYGMGYIAGAGTINPTSSATTDLGELGGTNLPTITAGAPIFFNQPRLSPAKVATTTPFGSTQYAGLTVWYNAAAGATYTSNVAVGLIRVRGTLAGSDNVPASPALALFFRGSTAWTPLGPAGTAVSTGEYRCWTSALGKCFDDRTIGTWTIDTLSAMDAYQIISTNAVFSTSNSQSVSILTKVPNAITFGGYRLAWVTAKGYYYLDAADKAITITAGTVVSAVSQTCDIDTGAGTHPTIRISPDGTQVDSTSVTMKFNYKVTTAGNIAITNKKGGLVWCAQWNFQNSGFAFGSNTLESTPDKCVAFDYRAIDTAANYWCISCPVAGTAVGTTDGTTINLANFKTFPADTILNATFGNGYDDTGALIEISQCDTTSNAFVPTTATAGTVQTVYNQPGQKVVITLSVPNTLREVDTITLDGRTQASYTSSGSDNSFPQGSFDANSVCYLASSGESSYNNYDLITCPSTGSTGTITFTVTGALNELRKQMSSVKIVTWGFGGAVAATNNPATVQYFAMYTKRSTAKVDATKTSASSDLVSWTLSTSTAPLVFSITQIGYNRPLLNARGSFRWEFSSTSARPLWKSDSIVFNLDAVVTANDNKDNTVVMCRITDTTEAVHNQNFKSCTLDASTSPATLKLIPWFSNSEYSASNVRVLLDGMKTIGITTGAAKTVWGSVNFLQSTGSKSLLKDNTGTELSSPGSDISSKSFPTNYPSIKKYWAQPNGHSDLEFTLISSFPLNDTCRVTIEFPTYYATGLSTRHTAPTCTIDGTPTRCTVNTRTLTVDAFPVSRSVNTQFIIRVSGIAAPQSGVTADNFWIQVNQANNEAAATVVYAAAVKEVFSTATTVNGIHVNWHTTSSRLTRSLTTLTWVINPLNTEDHDNKRSVHVLFPPWWGLANGRFAPTCRVYDYAITSNVYTAAQSIIGNNVILNLQTTLSQNRIVSLECQNVRTPEFDGTYPSQDIQIRIVAQDGTVEYQRSSPAVHNVWYGTPFAKSSALNYIDWSVGSSSSLLGPFTLARGTYNVPLGLNVPGRSQRNFQVNVAPNNFGFINTAFNASIGYDSFTSIIGCPGSVPLNTYALLFTITDNTLYTVPAAQWVAVTNDQLPISVSQSGDVTIGFTSGSTSKSNPVTFSALPFSDVTITPSTDVNNNNFTVSPSSITLGPIVNWGSFVWSTTGSTTSTGGIAVYAFALSGTNAVSFQTPAVLNVKTTADTNNYLLATPTLSIGADGNDQSKPTFKALSLTLGGVDTATIYFGCQLLGTWSLDANGIYRDATVWGYIDKMSPEQGQYDWLVTSKSSNSYTIDSLLPDRWYECRGYANSQSNKNSSIASYNFRTGTNGGSYNRFLFNHTTYPNPAQRQALLCTLIMRLAVPLTSVIAVTGETCGNQSAFYKTDNSSGFLAVYFVPRIVESEDVMTLANLQAALNTTENLRSLNASVVNNGGAIIYNILNDGVQKQTAVSGSFPSSGSVGDTWVAVSGCSLNDTGYITAILGSNSSAISNAAQFVTNTNSSGLLGYQVAYYNPSLGSASFNFSGLQSGTTYNVYLLGNNDDPSPYYSNFTGVSTVQLTTTAPPTDSGLALFCSVVMALIAMISILI